MLSRLGELSHILRVLSLLSFFSDFPDVYPLLFVLLFPVSCLLPRIFEYVLFVNLLAML